MPQTQHLTHSYPPTHSLVIIAGPTASGKSALGIDLAKAIGGEIISADSVQVYRGFDIGSGKLGVHEQMSIPHHLISILDPDEAFDAGRFSELAWKAIGEIRGRKKIPIVVGGTGLYIEALINGLANTPEVDSEKMQEFLEWEAQKIGATDSEDAYRQALFVELTERDPRFAQRLNPRDVSRVRRALMVHFATGKSLGDYWQDQEESPSNVSAFVVAFLPDRQTLYRRIDARVEQMFSDGFVEEVRGLRNCWGKQARGLGSIGYKQICQYLDGEIMSCESVGLIKRDTRRFAKRQYTWWRNRPAKLGWGQLQLSETPIVNTQPLAQEFISGEIISPRGLLTQIKSLIEKQNAELVPGVTCVCCPFIWGQ